MANPIVSKKQPNAPKNEDVNAVEQNHDRQSARAHARPATHHQLQNPGLLDARAGPRRIRTPRRSPRPNRRPLQRPVVPTQPPTTPAPQHRTPKPKSTIKQSHRVLIIEKTGKSQ